MNLAFNNFLETKLMPTRHVDIPRETETVVSKKKIETEMYSDRKRERNHDEACGENQFVT